MAFRPWRWLVLFFTRPIRLSDFALLAAWLKPRARPEPASAPAVVAVAPSAAATEVPRWKSTLPPEEITASKRASAPMPLAAMLQTELAIAVSEQPIDTLPAELREELQRPPTGRLQGSLRDV